MLASGAHVSIDGTEFMIHEDQDLPFPSYSHNLEPLFVGRQDVSGKPGRQNIRPELALWALDDWSGGEGTEVFDPDIPNKYKIGTGNPRLEGQLRGRPERDDDTHTLAGITTTVFQGKDLTDVTGTGEAVNWYKDIGRTITNQTFEGNHGSWSGGTLTGSDRLLNAGESTIFTRGAISDGYMKVTFRVRLENQPEGRETAPTARLIIRRNAANISVYDVVPPASFADYSFWVATTGESYDWWVESIGDPTTAVKVRLDYVAETHYGPAAETVQQAGRTPGAVAVTVDFSIAAIGAGLFVGKGDGLVNHEIDVIDDLDALPAATGGTSNPTTVSNLAGHVVVPIKFTGIAGRTYRYRIKKTSATDHDLIRAHSINETLGAGYPGDMALAQTQGAVWIVFGDMAARSENGKTWELKALSVAPGGGYKAIAACADDQYLYALFHDNPAPGSTGNTKLMRVSYSSGATWTSELMIGPTASQPYPVGIAVSPGIKRLYYWNTNLNEVDTSLGAGWAYTAVHTTVQNNSGSYVRGITSVDDNSVCYFVSSPGHTVVYQYKDTVGRVLWYLPSGVTGKGIVYSQGLLFLVAGDNVSASPGVDLYALNMRSEQSSHLGRFRSDDDGAMYPVSVGMGPGTSFLIGCNEGHVFQYDVDKQALSTVDHLENEIARASTTFLNRRIVATGVGGGPIVTHTYEPDFTDGKADFEVESPLWDFDFPEAEKTLQGFMVNCKEVPAGSSVKVHYRIDGSDDAYTLAGSVTVSGRVFLSAPTGANTVLFNTLQMKLEGLLGTAVATPKILSVTAYTSIRDKQETWDLILRAFHEDDDNPRPSSSQRRAEEIRDGLVDISNVGRQVTFLDGYRKERSNYSTNTVLIDEVSDIIRKSTSEGYVRVKLRKADA